MILAATTSGTTSGRPLNNLCPATVWGHHLHCDKWEFCLVIWLEQLSYPSGTTGCNLREPPLNVAIGYITRWSGGILKCPSPSLRTITWSSYRFRTTHFKYLNSNIKNTSMEVSYHFKKKMVIPSKFFHLLVPSNAVSAYLVTGINWVNWYLKEFPIEQLLDCVTYTFMTFSPSR